MIRIPPRLAIRPDIPLRVSKAHLHAGSRLADGAGLVVGRDHPKLDELNLDLLGRQTTQAVTEDIFQGEGFFLGVD